MVQVTPRRVSDKKDIVCFIRVSQCFADYLNVKGVDMN